MTSISSSLPPLVPPKKGDVGTVHDGDQPTTGEAGHKNDAEECKHMHSSVYVLCSCDRACMRTHRVSRTCVLG